MDAPEAPEPGLNLVLITLCDACIDGVGGECHTAGCALWLNTAPDILTRDHPMIHSIHPMDMAVACAWDDRKSNPKVS